MNVLDKLNTNFENKDLMLDIACNMLLDQKICPLNTSEKDIWSCLLKDKKDNPVLCVRCIRLYLKYLSEKEN